MTRELLPHSPCLSLLKIRKLRRDKKHFSRLIECLLHVNPLCKASSLPTVLRHRLYSLFFPSFFRFAVPYDILSSVPCASCSQVQLAEYLNAVTPGSSQRRKTHKSGGCFFTLYLVPSQLTGHYTQLDIPQLSQINQVHLAKLLQTPSRAITKHIV